MTLQDIHSPDRSALERHAQRQPDSPALVPLAVDLLQKGEAGAALELCRRILTAHPDSPTALLAASRAASLLGRSSELAGLLTRLRALVPLLYDRLIAGLAADEEPRRRRDPVFVSEEAPRPRRLRWSDEEHLIPEPELPGRMREEPPSPEPQPDPVGPLDLETLAALLEHAHVPAPVEDLDEPDVELESAEPTGFHRPVTDTLAAIYARQGRIVEAIAAYEELALRRPEQAALYMLRIQELRHHMLEKGTPHAEP